MQQTSRAAPFQPGAQIRPLRILIVDDDTMIAGLLAEMLEGNGHTVCGIEATEAGAVSAAACHRPDLMIVDVCLRAGSGLQAMEQVQRSGPLPHVFMSGGVLPTGSHMLRKPFREADLLQAIERTLTTAGFA